MASRSRAVAGRAHARKPVIRPDYSTPADRDATVLSPCRLAVPPPGVKEPNKPSSKRKGQNMNIEKLSESIIIITDDDHNRHQGVECAYCHEVIEAESDGISSPHGSMHLACADEHEAEHPDDW
jgi:hypothetical protein